MSGTEEMSFPARLRKTGANQTSLILTVDATVRDAMNLQGNDIVQVTIKKIRRVK